MTLSGLASVTSYQLALSQIGYENGQSNPNTATRVLDFECTDSNGLVGSKVTSTVNIVPVNDAPVLDLDSSDPLSTGFSTTALEQVETPIVAVTGLKLTDVDSSSLVQCRAQIMNPSDGDFEILDVKAYFL